LKLLVDDPADAGFDRFGAHQFERHEARSFSIKAYPGWGRLFQSFAEA
jgi:hypothetical protein